MSKNDDNESKYKYRIDVNTWSSLRLLIETSFRDIPPIKNLEFPHKASYGSVLDYSTFVLYRKWRHFPD